MKESLLVVARNAPIRRGRNLNGALPTEADENLDLFSKNRRSFSLASSDDSEGRLSIGSGKVTKNGIDDLLSFPGGGKNDYDWLLTPPGTPLVAPSEGVVHQRTTAPPRSSSASRNESTMKNSRLSVTHTENNHSSKPTRSNSVTRPSVSASQYTSYNSSRSSSILNTSSASVSSYIRPSSPMACASSVSRPSTSSTCPIPSRSTTPARVRSTTFISPIDKPRPSSRPSTPTSRKVINPPNLTSPVPRLNSRPSTPPRRMPSPSLSTTAMSPTPGRRNSLSGLTATSAPGSRRSSPSPRLKPSPQPSVLRVFPHETPPNLRTTLPDRPLSAGRSRPGLSTSGKDKTETTSSGNSVRRQASPVGMRGKILVPEPTAKVRAQSNGHAEITETRRITHLQGTLMNKSIRILSSTSDSTGFGRTVSKKSLDMAIRHMDIRNGTVNTRQLSGTTLFRQCIRPSAGTKTQAVRSSSDLGSYNYNNTSLHNKSAYFENGNHMSSSINCITEEISHLSAKLRELDIYESSRYDAILLKEDLKNTKWLRSFDEHSNPGSLFDNGFESLPEPFDPL